MTWKEWFHKKRARLNDLLRWHWNRNTAPDDPQERGRWGEWQAGRFLKKKRFRLLLSNVALGKNEVDWIAIDEDHLVFIEVKTRDAEFMDRPILAIDWRKRIRLREAAKIYIKSLHLETPPSFRFDAVEIVIHQPHYWECRWTPRLEID
jgi:putative endonuclease